MSACPCEKQSQSEHPSPGPVENSEKLLRLVYYSEHVDADGTLKVAAVNKSDIKRQVNNRAPERGWSVNRQDYVCWNVLQSKAEKQQENAKDDALRAEVWTFRVDVAAVRELLVGRGERSLCVVDQAEIGDNSHAEVWGAIAGRNDSVLRQIRAQLLGLMERAFRAH